MEQQKAVQPRQKVITILLRTYSQAIQSLKHRNFQEGIALLQSLLQHPYIDDSDMQNLKFSIFMSLGEVHELLQSVMLAVGFYWQALKLHQKRCKMADKRDMRTRLQNQERTDEQFTILLKMVLLIENTQHNEELIFLLKRAIKISPSLWRDKLLQKLQTAYLREGNQQCLEDLQSLMENKVDLEEVLNQSIQYQSCKRSPQEMNASSILSQQTYLQKICLKVNLKEKDEIFVKYSCWQNLLTSIYVLLKCKHSRNFNKKKYLHKKYDQSDQNWNEGLKKYSLTKTKIQIKIVEKEESPQQQPMQVQNQVSFQKMVNDLSEQLLKYKYGKKKSKKVANPFEQLSRLPSLSAKDSKKVLTTQTKSIYSSICEYHKQLFVKSNINKQKLKYLKQFNQELFNKILAKTLNDEPCKQKMQNEQNEDDQMEISNSMAHEVNATQRESKEKKSSRTKKAEMIERNRSLSSLIVSVLKIQKQDRTKQYSNVIELFHQIAQCLFSQDNAEGHHMVINVGIKNVLQKDLVKTLELGEGFFQSIDSVNFFDILMDKLQSMIDKESKTKEFKSHQQNKINILSAFIKEKYLPNTHDLQQLLTTELSIATLKRLVHLTQNFCRFYSLYQMSLPSEMSFYRQLYIIFKKKLESKMNHREFNEKERQKAIAYFIDKQIEKYQKKAVSRNAIMAIKDENEEVVSTVDQIYKKDQQILAILPLLKIFNCHPEQSKNKNNQMSQQFTGQIYLLSFVKLCEIFFKKIQLQSYKEFNSRILTLLADIMKLKNVINELYDKFIDTTVLKSPDISKDLYIETLFYLIRIYLLNLQESDNYLKISFFITNLLLRNEQEEKKSILLPKIICSFDELIKFKKFKPDMLNSIRKRLYQNLILKNLSCIYNSPLIIQNQARSEKKEGANQKMEEEVHLNSQSRNLKAIADQNEQVREKILDLIHDVYFCPEKDKQFNPKRIEEAVSYFVYLLKAYAQMFERKIIELENEAIKVFRRCYKLYLQKRDEVYRLCDKVFKFKVDFQLFMNGEESKLDKNWFIGLLKQERSICECCSNLARTHNFYVQSLFVIGKYFESQCAQPQLYFTKQSWIEDSDKDKNYYFEYLTLNLQKQLAWQNIVRVNCLKSFYYFDSLLTEPYDKYKNKFLYTKRLIHLVNQIHPQYTNLTITASANLEILNILKIKQRELLMLTKKIKLAGVQTKESRELQWKYKEGMKKILVSGNKLIGEDLRIKYLRLSQLKIKILWGNVDKDMKQQKLGEDMPVIIELDDDSQDAKVIHKPSKNIKQLQELIDEAKTIIKELPLQEQNYFAVHLEQDIAVQLYILLCKHLELKLDYSINSICSSIGLNHAQKGKRVKEAEFYLSDLNYTLQLAKNGEFLSSSQRYSLKNQNMKVSNDDFSAIQMTFSNIFCKNENEPKHMMKQERQSSQLAMKNEQIVINDEQNQQAPRDIEGQRMSEQSGRQSRRSNSKSRSSKQNSKTKALKLDLATYIYDKVVKYIIKNKLFAQPLNHLQTYLFAVQFQQIVLKMSKVLVQVSRVIIDLPKYQIKKFRNRRSVVMSLVYCSHLAIKYTKNTERPLELIKDYVNMKSEVITHLNLYNDKMCAEKNQLLSDFYNRGIVHQIMKIEVIRHLFDIHNFQKNKEAFVLLNKKLLKLSKLGETKVEKPKQEKQAVVAVVEGDQGKKVKQKEAIQLNTSKESKDAQGSKTLEAQTAFSLFCEGSMHFMEILKKQAQYGEIDQKYQKNLLQFKNKIKKELKADQKNIFYSKIEEFLNLYQQKYNKKIKMKKMKKDKEGQVLPVILQKPIQIQPVQIVQKEQFSCPINVQALNTIQKGKVERSHSKSSEKNQPKNEIEIEIEQKVQTSSKRKKKQVKQVPQSIRRLSSRKSKGKKQKAVEQSKQAQNLKKKQVQVIQIQKQKDVGLSKRQSENKHKQSTAKKEKTTKIKRVAVQKQKKQTPSNKKNQQS